MRFDKMTLFEKVIEKTILRSSLYSYMMCYVPFDYNFYSLLKITYLWTMYETYVHKYMYIDIKQPCLTKIYVYKHIYQQICYTLI